jgi:PAS domain S-box-containing protein
VFPLDDLVDRAFDGLVMIDSQQRIIRFNQGAERIFGYRAEEVLGQPLDRLLPAQFIANHRQHVQDFLQAPEVSRPMGGGLRIVTGRHKDGREFPAEATIAKSLADTPEQCYLAVFLRDYSARQQAEQARQAAYTDLQQRVRERTAELEAANTRLQEEIQRREQAETLLRASHEELERLVNARTVSLHTANQHISERQRAEDELRKTSRAVEQSPASIVITDLNGTIEYVNPKFVEITGYSAAEAIGQNPRLLKSGETRPERYQELWQTIASGREWRGEFHNRKKNGELYWEMASISPVKDPDGTITHYLAVKEDITQRKQAEAALRLDESRLEALLRFSTMTAASEQDITDFALEEGVRLTDSQIGYLHFINDDQVSLQLFSWSKAVHSQCTAEKTSHYPLAEAGVWVDCVRQRRPVIHNDYPNLPDRKGYPEGHIHVVRHLSVPVLDGDRLVAVAGVGNKREPYDDTDARQLSLFMNSMWALLQRRRAELAVQQLNAELEQRVKQRTAEVRDLYNNAPCGYHSLDADGWIIHVNNTELHCLGYPREQLVRRRRFADLLTPASAERFRQSYALLQERGWVKDLELEMVRQDGSVFPALLSETAVRNDQGRFVMSRSTLVDISGRKAAETARRQSEERFRRYFELSLIGMAVTSPQKDWLEVNDRLCEMLGYSRAELTHLTWAELTHPADLEIDLDYFSRMLNGELDGYTHDKRFIHKDGHVVDASISVKPLYRPDGSVDCFVALVQDIGERKQTEAELRYNRDELSAANAELARAARLKDEFLASMSHELRTPLTGILNLSEALQEQVYGPLTDKQQQSLRTIEESGRHLLDLINDILDLSRIEAGQLQLHLDNCLAAEVCQSSLQLIKGMAHKKRQQLAFVIHPPGIELVADARRLKQMLFNLLGNAVKFTPAGGNIGLQVTGDEAAGVVRFSVWDTGIGIAATDLPKLFRPFTQLDSRLSRQYSGTGLGLSLVQRMTDLHGGSISVESTPGQGSRFTITLPRRPAAEAVRPTTPAAMPPPPTEPPAAAADPAGGRQ